MITLGKPVKGSLSILLVIITAALLYLISAKNLVFGSAAGKWIYPYIADFTITPIITALIASGFIITAAYFSSKYIGKREIPVIIGLCVIGFFIQMVLRSSCPFSIDQIIKSEGANSFYDASMKYNILELLSKYNSISELLPPHAKTNMIGKTLFYYLLKLFSSKPLIMGYLIVAFSNIGAVLVYYVCKLVFKNRLVAIYSLILYLLFPAKIFFFPILNTVSPVFILLPLFLMLKYLSGAKDITLILFGISLYFLFIFEPLLLTAGIILLAVLLKYYTERRINTFNFMKLVVYPAIFFIMMHLVFLFIFKYDAIKNFVFIYNDAMNYFIGSGRNYNIWLAQNLKNFFINAGLLQSVLFFILFSYYIYRILKYPLKKAGGYRKIREFIFKPGPLMVFSVAALILAVDSSGVTRGEIIRLWIFIMVFFQILTAYFCVVTRNRLTLYIVLTSNIFQTAVSISMVGFIMPTFYILS